MRHIWWEFFQEIETVNETLDRRLLMIVRFREHQKQLRHKTSKIETATERRHLAASATHRSIDLSNC